MGSYVTITTMGGSDQWTVSNTTGKFGFAVLRSNRTASPDTVTASWTLNGQTTQVWNASMSLGDTKYWYIQNTQLLIIMNNTGQSTMTMTASCGGETVTVTATIRIDPTVFYPDVTRWSWSIVNTPLSGILVRGYSSVRYSFTAKKGQGASQVLVNFTAPYGTFNPTGMNSRADTFNGQTQFYVEGGSSDLTFTTKIEGRDSRGMTTDSMTSNATWKGYTKPEITATAVRCDSNGNPDESGAYAKITFSASYSLRGVGNVGHVTMTTGGTTYTDPSAPVIVSQSRATTTTYTITATDTVLNSVGDSVTKKVTVNMAKFPLDLYDDGHGHFGARVGTIAESGYFSCGLKQKGIYFYGTCGTAKGTARKTVTVDQTFQLYTGVLVFVKFTNSNTIADPTLNVNGTGAIAIKRYGTTAPSTSATTSWNAGTIFGLMYDGTYWMLISWLNNNTTYSLIAEADIKDSAHTTARLIDGQRFKQGLDSYMVTGTFVYSDTVSRAVDTFSFTDANMIGKSRIICSTQDSSQPVKTATLTSSTGAITVTLARAVHVVRINYLCF